MTRIPELEQELVAAAGRLPSTRRPLRPGSRWALTGAAVGAALVVLALLGATEQNDADRRLRPVGAAPGAKVVTSVEAGVRFSLDGRVVTVHLLPTAPSQTVRRVSGARISATCGANLGAPTGDPRAITLTRRWPPGRASLHYRFPRDVSTWCKLNNQGGNFHVFVWFPGVSPAPREVILLAASNWAQLFASSLQNCNDYMGQPACERMSCQRVGAPRPIPDCTRPSRAYRLSFRAATVQEIAIKGDRAAARFSNGETIELQGTDRSWGVAKWGENAGRGFFE